MKSKLQFITSMVLYGTLSVFIRNIPLPSAAVALCRAGIALAALLGFQAVRGKLPDVKGMGGDLPLLCLSGAAMGFNWIFLFEAYKYTTVSVATLSYYFAPVIVMLACPVLFHERMTAKQVACFIGSTVGLILVINVGALTEGGDHLRGVAFGLAAATLYASVILMNKRITRASGLDRTVLQFAGAALVLVPYVLLTGGLPLGGMKGLGWACLICVGLVHTALAYVLYFSALKDLPGQEAAILSYIDPLVAVLISLTVLGEPVTPLQLLGGAMILAFTLINELGQ